MDREENLERSRRENKNKDLAELDVTVYAGNMAGRVGACVCCLVSIISRVVTGEFIYSPWVIYFSILGTQYIVKYSKVKRRSDLWICVLYFGMCLFTLSLFIMRLAGVKT